MAANAALPAPCLPYRAAIELSAVTDGCVASSPVRRSSIFLAPFPFANVSHLRVAIASCYRIVVLGYKPKASFTTAGGSERHGLHGCGGRKEKRGARQSASVVWTSVISARQRPRGFAEPSMGAASTGMGSPEAARISTPHTHLDPSIPYVQIGCPETPNRRRQRPAGPAPCRVLDFHRICLAG